MSSGNPTELLRIKAIAAPNVTSSPWAKLVSPVVPKISDNPMAHSPMSRPNLMPMSVLFSNELTENVESFDCPAPTWKLAV